MAKSFGEIPVVTRVRIQVQELKAGRAILTRSFTVFGKEFDDVIEGVEQHLTDTYGNGEDTEEEEEEEVAAPPPAKRKKVVKR